MSLDITVLRGTLTATLLLAAMPAAAQQNLNEPPNTVAPTERMQSHSAWHLSRTVSDHVGRVLTGRPQADGTAAQGTLQGTLPAATMRETPEATGPEATGPEATGPEATGPVASATGETPLWSAWVGPNNTWSDQDDGASGNEGHTFTTHLGIDRRVGARGVVGVMAGFELSDFDTASLDGRLETEGAGIGIYGGYSLSDTIVLDALALYTWVDNDYADRARSASYDSERLQLSANLTGYFTEGRLSIRPKLGVSYSLGRQEAYSDTLGIRSPETDTETVGASAGVQLGYTVFLDQTRTVEPHLGVTATLEDSSTDPAPAAGGDELGAFDLRVSAGVTARPAERVSLSLNADVSGLARQGYEAVTVGGQVSLQF